MTLSEKSTERVDLLFELAKRNGSLISIHELTRLLATSTSEQEVAKAIMHDPHLSSRFEITDGYVVERRPGGGASDLREESRNRVRARSNMALAVRFERLLRPARFRMVAVSGSTSYGSASSSKDLDLFCVAPAGRLWYSLTWGLIMARVFALVSPRSPCICLSCIMDERYAFSLFSRAQGPLFARDAIETKVVRGRDTHSSLMRAAGWITAFYPGAYESSEFSAAPLPTMNSPSVLERVTNRFIFITVGKYMRLKSALLNRRLRTAHRSWDVFEIQCSEDHLVYESKRYASMRQRYTEAFDFMPDVRR